MDAGAQAQRDQALQGVRQGAVLQVVVEEAGRAGVGQQVGVALLQAAGREAPVPLRRPLHAGIQPRESAWANMYDHTYHDLTGVPHQAGGIHNL